MKFLCLKEKLEKALVVAERFTGKNVTLPILGNVLLETDETMLYVTATNLEYAVRIKVPGKVLRSGKVSVPAKIVSSLVQSTRFEKIDLEEKRGNLFITTDTRNSMINGISVDDFPLLPKIKKTAFFVLDHLSLTAGLFKVLPAVSLSEFKPELNGIFFRVSGNILYLAATDTFRLAEKILELTEKSQGEGGEINFILPQRMAQELTRLPAKDELTVSLGDNQVLFETDEIKIISRLIEGNFPEYSGIVPKNFEITSFIKKDELIEAVRSSSIFVSKLQEVRLNLGSQILEIASANPEVGEYKTRLEAQSSGKGLSPNAGQEGGISLNFNFRYLLDGLNSLDDKEVFLGFNSENSPTILRNKEEGSFKYILMPIRVS